MTSTAVADGMAALAAVAATAARPGALRRDDADARRLRPARRAARPTPATAAIPVILLSARAGEESRVEGLEAGADDYLIKPFSARELLARVSAHLELARVRRIAADRERELRAEAEYILESITDGFLALDRDWRLTYVNAEAERIYRKPARGDARPGLLGALPGGRRAPGSRRNSAGRSPSRSASTLRAIYEPWDCWFEVKAYPSRDGGLAVYFRDITERKHGLRWSVSWPTPAPRSPRRSTTRRPCRAWPTCSFPMLADLCVFDVRGRDGTLQRRWLGLRGRGRYRDRPEAIDRFVPRRSIKDHPVIRVLNSGETELVPDVTDDWLRAVSIDAEHLQFLRESPDRVRR